MNGMQPSYAIGAMDDIERSAADCRRWSEHAEQQAEEHERAAAQERSKARAYRAKADEFEAILRKARAVDPVP